MMGVMRRHLPTCEVKVDTEDDAVLNKLAPDDEAVFNRLAPQFPQLPQPPLCMGKGCI